MAHLGPLVSADQLEKRAAWLKSVIIHASLGVVHGSESVWHIIIGVYHLILPLLVIMNLLLPYLFQGEQVGVTVVIVAKRT